MGEEEDAESMAARKTYWRSSSWSASRSPAPELCAAVGEANSEKISGDGGVQRRCPFPPLTPRSQNSKARSSLPPLQPLSIARRSYNEWPKAGSDDVGEWLHPPTPSGRPEGLKLDLSSIQSGVKKDQIAFFDKECSKVAQHIYLGGDSVARNRDILRQNGITHVLNCVGFVCPEYFKSDLVYKTLWLQDSPTEDITSILYDVFDYFEDVKDQGGRVFVHCCQGVSRSTSLVIAYLMWREGHSFDDALELVKSARSIANPNVGFAGQLLQCQKRVHAIPLSPNSVLRMYRMAPHSSYDPLHLVPKMLNEPSPAALDSRGAFIVHFLSSIFIWIGKECKPVMEKDAKAAAFQVVRYEKVHGSIVSVIDGLEPAEFWEAFSNSSVSSESSDVQINKDYNRASIKIDAGKRRVESYNVDFELFYKAITGGVVPPFSSSSLGQETHLPARESNWSILRRKFMSGTIGRFYASHVIVKDVDSHFHRVQLLSMESLASPPFPSPSSRSSDSSSFSKSSSESPSESPSTSFSSSLAPSPASSNYNDSLFPPSTDLLCLTSNSEVSKPSAEDVHSPSKVPARSIAERRASFSPLKLPSLSKDVSLLARSSTNPPSVQKLLEDDMSEIASRTWPDLEFKRTDRCDTNGFKSETKRSSVLFHNDLLQLDFAGQIDLSSLSSYPFQPLVYRWPRMETLTTLHTEDINSNALLLLLTSSVGRGKDLDRRLFLWVGSCFEQNKLDRESEVGGKKEVMWCQVCSEFLSSMGLPNDIPFKVVEGEKSEEFLRLISSFP